MTPAARRLADRIRTDGPIPFAAFMEEALYGEDGYYRRERLPIGPGADCDFVTAPALSPLFGRCTARLLRRLDSVLGRPATLLEAGSGNGDHLVSIATPPTVASGPVPDAGGRGNGPVPDTSRRILAWDRTAHPLPAGVERLAELDDLASGTVRGLVFSCELFDALPVHRLIGTSDGTAGELYVTLSHEGSFTWQEGVLSDPDLMTLLDGHRLQPGQIADLAPDSIPLHRNLARCLGRGLLVTVDYGYERDRLLDPRPRRHGTLACYRRHRVHRDPFRHVGDQDLTAHVDFTALRQAGEEAGLTTVAFVRLAEWLTGLGIFDDLQDADAVTRSHAMALLDPNGMGHDLRVLVQARGVEEIC